MTPSADLVGLADRIHAYAGPQRNARLMNVPADMLHKWATELRALAGTEVGGCQYSLSYRGTTGYWHIACGSRDVLATEDKDKASYYLELLNYPHPGSGRGGVESS